MRLMMHAASPTGLLTLRAATDAGVLPAARDRVLVFDSRTPGGAAVARAIEAGAPLHPSDTHLDLGGRPDAADVLRSLAPEVVVLDAAAAGPGDRLASALPQARLVLLETGALLAAPTPGAFSRSTLSRITDLVYADLVPGLKPVLGRERTLKLHPVGIESLRTAADAWARCLQLPRRLRELNERGHRCLLVLGTTTPSLAQGQDKEATRLAARQVNVALDTGSSVVVHLPEPGAERATEAALAEACAEAGLSCAQLPSSLPAAVAHALLRPHLTVSVDAPWLLALRASDGERVQSVATGRLLPRLSSAASPRRTQLALTDAVLRRGVPLPAEEETAEDGPGLLQRIVDAVAYATDPEKLSALRPAAACTLLDEPALRSAYVPKQRVQALHLETPLGGPGQGSGRGSRPTARFPEPVPAAAQGRTARGSEAPARAVRPARAARTRGWWPWTRRQA